MCIIEHGKFCEPYQYMGDLLYYEGVLLGHLRIQGLDYLVKWCDITKDTNIWAVFPIALDDLKKYVNGQITLHQLMLQVTTFTVVDIDTNGCIVKHIMTKTLPQDFMPNEASFYEFITSSDEEYSNYLKGIL